MFEVVKSIIEEHLDIDDSSRVTLQSTLEDFNADSLDVAEIIMALEDEFKIEIEDEKAENFKTLKDIMNYLEEQQLQ